MIDFYLEEERILRAKAAAKHINATVIEHMVDELWGKVTLYNCYQLFVVMSSKKIKNPVTLFKEDYEKGKYNSLSNSEISAISKKEKAKAEIWDNQPQADVLTLYFNATDRLPRNQMRTLVGNANSALRSMGGAEKMLSSVYGIAITAMVRACNLCKECA